jgi:heptose-I-phosphate ethanolaminephosphotransferase
MRMFAPVNAWIRYLRSRRLLTLFLASIYLCLPFAFLMTYKVLVISFILTVASFILFRSSLTRTPWFILLFLASLLQLGYTIYAGKLIDEYYWIASFATNKNETLQFLSTLSYADLAIFLLYIISGAFLLFILKADFSRSNLYWDCGVLFIIFASLSLVGYSSSLSQTAGNSEFIKKTVSIYYPSYIFEKYKSAKRIQNNLFGKHQFAYELKSSLVDEIYVFLGESSSKSRYSVYGYPKETTPGFSSGDWLRFDNYVSNGLNTQPNLKTFFSGHVLNGASQVDNDIFRVAKKAGFKTFYVDNNKYRDLDPIYMIGAQADDYFSLNGIGRNTTESDNTIKFDDLITPHLDRILVEKQPKKLVFLHLVGSHPVQKLRYPNSFDKFDNAYDNSVYYTDYVVNKWKSVIEKSTASKSVVIIYVADHGVKLPPGCGMGEIKKNDYNAYGADDRFASSVEVPLLIWTSEKFRRENPNLMSNLKRNKSSPIDHTFFLPTLSRIMGYVSIEGYDLIKKELFNPSLNFIPRLNTEMMNIDEMYRLNKICKNN